MKGEKLLLKTFFASLLVHITGISLFVIILPNVYSPKQPIEVSLLPPSMSPEDIHLAKIKIMPEIPETKAHYEKLDMPFEQETVKLSAEKFTGFSENLPVIQISPRFEFPEFNVQFPTISEFQTPEQLASGSIMSMDIEGPGGDRQVIYREVIKYPLWAQQQGMEGNIKIKFWVDSEGRITSTTIKGSSGFPELDIYAEESFRKWLFNPVKTDKEVWGLITFRFRLK